MPDEARHSTFKDLHRTRTPGAFYLLLHLLQSSALICLDQPSHRAGHARRDREADTACSTPHRPPLPFIPRSHLPSPPVPLTTSTTISTNPTQLVPVPSTSLRFRTPQRCPSTTRTAQHPTTSLIRLVDTDQMVPHPRGSRRARPPRRAIPASDPIGNRSRIPGRRRSSHQAEARRRPLASARAGRFAVTLALSVVGVSEFPRAACVVSPDRVQDIRLDIWV